MEKRPHSYYTVRFGDCDPFGHLNNARYVDYFINAREDHLKEAYQMDMKQFYAQGMTWLVGGHEINYLKPADYNERIRIASSIIDAGADYLLVEMVMTDNKETHIKAVIHTRFIHVGLKSGRRENHPEGFMDFAKSIAIEWNGEPFAQRVKSLVKGTKAAATA